MYPWNILGYHMNSPRCLHGHPEDTAMASPQWMPIRDPQDTQQDISEHHMINPQNTPMGTSRYPMAHSMKNPSDTPIRHLQASQDRHSKVATLYHGEGRASHAGGSQHTVALGLDPVPRASPCPWPAPVPNQGRARPQPLPQPPLCPQETGNNEVLFMHLDLASLRSVRAFASTFLHQEPQLHLLINNAGECQHPKKPLCTPRTGTTSTGCHCLLAPQV